MVPGYLKTICFHQVLLLNCAFQGQVIEVGNHRELVEKGGRYAELWEHQQQEENGEVENEKL